LRGITDPYTVDLHPVGRRSSHIGVSKQYIDDRIDPVRCKCDFIQPPATNGSVTVRLCNKTDSEEND
jgi:hypothetical protein